MPRLVRINTIPPYYVVRPSKSKKSKKNRKSKVRIIKPRFSLNYRNNIRSS